MGPVPTAAQSVLVYNRIAANRRKTWLLVAIAIASIVPFVAAVSYGVTRGVFAYFGHRGHVRATISEEQEQRMLARVEEYPEEYRERMREHLERRLAAERAAAAAALAR